MFRSGAEPKTAEVGEPEELTEVEQARQTAARSAFADVHSAMGSGDRWPAVLLLRFGPELPRRHAHVGDRGARALRHNLRDVWEAWFPAHQ